MKRLHNDERVSKSEMTSGSKPKEGWFREDPDEHISRGEEVGEDSSDINISRDDRTNQVKKTETEEKKPEDDQEKETEWVKSQEELEKVLKKGRMIIMAIARVEKIMHENDDKVSDLLKLYRMKENLRRKWQAERLKAKATKESLKNG